MRIILLVACLAIVSCSTVPKQENDGYPTYRDWKDGSKEYKQGLSKSFVEGLPKTEFFMNNPQHKDTPRCLKTEKVDFTSLEGFVSSMDEGLKNRNPSPSQEEVLVCITANMQSCIHALARLQYSLIEAGRKSESENDKSLKVIIEYCQKRWL